MNYFVKGFFRDSKTYWISKIYFGILAIGVVDFISSALKPPGLFNYKWIIGTLILTVLLIIAYGIYLGKRGSDEKALEEMAAFLASDYEPRREKEIKDLLETNPHFTTHCYQCLHYDQDKSGCKRHLLNQRVKDLRVGNMKYCLYWETSDPA